MDNKPTPSNSKKPARDLHHSQGTEIADVIAAAEKDAAEQAALEQVAGPTVPVIAIHHDACSPVVQGIARNLYEAYLVNSGGLAWDGKACPLWPALNDAVRSHWCAAAREAFRRIAQLSACDVSLESR